jgi:beta-1,4-mannosyltransferase
MKPLVVQQSFPRPRPTTNPYIRMLAEAIEAVPGVELRYFSWRDAILGRYDVLHLHWPEILVSGQSPLKALVRQALTVLLMWKLILTRTAIVRTAHNLKMPEDISRRELALLRWIDKRTTLKIRLNELTEIDGRWAVATIPHGHYRDWFAKYAKPPAVRGRVGYFGLIRRYKGVDALLKAFSGVRGGYLSLAIGGKPSSESLAAELTALGSRDPRVTLTLEFLSEEQIVEIVGSSEIVVLPYREMHNSGGALTALSLGRPVLVPSNAVNALLATEMGEGWVYQFDGELTAASLGRTLTEVEARTLGPLPNLARREWTEAGTLHVEAYRRAIEVRRGRATPSGALPAQARS